MHADVEVLLAEQLAFYRAQAPRYERDAYLDQHWDQAIEELPIVGDILELACGSGHWTPMLAARGRSVTAVDAAPEMLALARQRVGSASAVEFVEADIFSWQPPRRYDTIFFAFWLTHVPPTRFAAFWSMVRTALAPGGQACFLDSPSREREHERIANDQATPAVWRRLHDGTEHRVVKVFYSPAELVARLAGLGWSANAYEASGPLLLGTARPTPVSP
jgi:ubiquinone/menaquinone biosynthesis C-methylase UbiE